MKHIVHLSMDDNHTSPSNVTIMCIGMMDGYILPAKAFQDLYLRKNFFNLKWKKYDRNYNI